MPWVIVANVTGDRHLRDGAKVRVMPFWGDGDSREVIGLSIGGRRIRKWTRTSRLSNFRPAFVLRAPAGQMVYGTKIEAAGVAERMASDDPPGAEHPPRP